MSTKKQFSSLCNFYSVYEEISKVFLDETDADSYFNHKILDISQSHRRISELARDPTKSLLPSKCFIFAIQSYSSDLFSRKKSAFLKRKLSFYSTVWVNFSKLLILATKYRRFHYPNQIIRLDSQKQKTNCSVIATRIYLSIWTDKFGYRSGLKRTRLAFFPSKSLNITVIRSFLQKLSTWVTAKSNISTRFDFLFLTSVTFMRAITLCSAFTTDFGYDNSTIILIGDVYCPNRKCSGKLCLHKTLFNLSAEAISNDHNARLCVRCAIFHLKIKQNPFSCRLVKGFTFLKRLQNQFKMLLEKCIVLTSIVSKERSANLLTVM